MYGVSFYYSSDTPTTSTDTVLHTSAPYVVCPDCKSNAICNSKNELQLFTPLTLYILRYLSLINLNTGIIYPYEGTWLHQPSWVLLAWNIAIALKNRIMLINHQRLTKKDK